MRHWIVWDEELGFLGSAVYNSVIAMCCCVYDVLSTFKFFLMEVVGMKRWFVLICVVVLASCQTLEQSLKSVDSALAVVNSGTARNISALTSSKDPSEALKQSLQQRSEYYKQNKTVYNRPEVTGSRWWRIYVYYSQR